MTDEDSEMIWPKPQFLFEVDFEGVTVSFAQVSGLVVDPTVIEYREGNNEAFSKTKLPGIQTSSVVALEQGWLPSGSPIWDWVSQCEMNEVTRKAVVIRLLDQTGKPTMMWTLAQAWLSNITSLEMKADSGKIAIEKMELVHEGLTIENGRA